MKLIAGQSHLVRQALVLAILLGLLLVPATCAHAAGPHSIFIDPRADETHHGHHDGETSLLEHVLFSQTQRPAVESASGTPEVETNAPTGRPMLHDLPTTMLVTIAASNMALDLPQLLMLPAADGPNASLSAERLAGIDTTIEPPPPRER